MCWWRTSAGTGRRLGFEIAGRLRQAAGRARVVFVLKAAFAHAGRAQTAIEKSVAQLVCDKPNAARCLLYFACPGTETAPGPHTSSLAIHSSTKRTGIRTHIELGLPPMVPGVNLKHATASSAALSSRSKPLDRSTTVCDGTPSATTKVFTSTVPVSSCLLDASGKCGPHPEPPLTKGACTPASLGWANETVLARTRATAVAQARCESDI
jgi:hypothetical protein